ncbi:MAG TPA: hypothetical protein VKY32_08315 [Flavobacterium sp.]|nr:hypothetical protein [Flavobacterium sp.]
MGEVKLETVLWSIAALIAVVVLYYFINRKNIRLEEAKRKHLKQQLGQQINHSITQKKATPQTLQAYERLMILIDRIAIAKLVSRVQPVSTVKKDYADFLIKNIEQEFDFNASQELYVSKEAWSVVDAAKNAVIQDVLKTTLSIESNSAYDLQTHLLQTNNSQALIALAKNKLREDVSNLV